MYHILMIDDEPAQIMPHLLFLQEKGCAVEFAQTAGEAVIRLCKESYDLLLLNVKMPADNGLDLCSGLRRLTKAPIIFLSSLAEDADRLRGFSAGGADYISKGCALELFLARICARLSQTERVLPMRVFPPLKLDLQHQRALINQQDLRLTQTEFQLLSLLSSRPGRIWPVEYRGIEPLTS